MSRRNLQTSNVQSYGGQARNPSSSNFGGVMQGRWQTNQPPVQQQSHIQQQQPPTQAQGQPRWRELQQLSHQQQQQLQAMLMRQSQPQRQQPSQQPQPQQPQQRLVQPQTMSYGQTSTTVPYSSQPLLPGYMHSGQGSTRPQVATTSAFATSSLEGALGNRGSRASSSSSRNATPVSAVQRNASSQNTAQGQQASTQNRRSLDKDAIAADVIQRMGPNYISNMVATAQANSSATVPKPPTRENRAVATAVSQSLPSSSSASQSRNAESLVNLEPRAATSPAQVLSNTRHIVAQRPTASAPAPAPPTIPVPLTTPVSLDARQAKSNAPPVQPLGASSTAGYGPTTASTAPFPIWPPPSTSSTRPSSSGSQSATSAQPHSVAPMALTRPEGGLNWGLHAPPGNESGSVRGGYQPGPPGSWVSQRKVPGTMASSNSDGQGLAAGAPMTPTNQQLQTDSSPRTPASADKKHLARDILRSLGGSRLLNGKRKRSEEPPVAAKRIRQLGAEPHSVGSMSSFQSNSALSDQQPAGDMLPIHNSDLRREEEEEDDDEIELVEDMTSFSPLPISGSSRSSKTQVTPIPSSTQLQLDDIIDISDDENQNLPAKPIQSVPIVAPALSPFPATGMVSSKAKEPLFLPSPSSSPRSSRSLQYLDNGALTQKDDNDEIEAPWDMPSMDVSAEQPLSLEPKKKGKIRMEPFVYIPAPPDWVKRAKQRSDKAPNGQQRNRQVKHNNAKRKVWIMEDDEVVGDSEHEIDEIEGWDGWTSQRGRELDTKEADGMTPNLFL
ncbi:hypothetical protein PILCRDRAFT_689843 [Piloderma croceum F 1598]|uniref:Uncharacterized protein n=1 Tax=Piloderma croceum (strain F 1598) TaxID=765440 RepID=A0A0C3ER08_PILCF|nr:hypothetical protein PILCRDRAFT_689843 [Piloderma croceum F 1598]